MNGFSVNLWILRIVANLWEEQADNLHAARKRLAAAGSQSETLGDRVGPIAKAYFETWGAEAGSQARAAQKHANALSMAGSSYAILDEQAANRLKELLPWDMTSTMQPLPICPIDVTGPLDFKSFAGPDLTEPPTLGPQP